MILWFLVLVQQATDSQGTSDATRLFLLQQPKRWHIAVDMPWHIPEHPKKLTTTQCGVVGPCRLPEEIPPAQHPLPSGPHKSSVSTPHSLLASATGTLRLWGVSGAADDLTTPHRHFAQTPALEQMGSTCFSARSKDEKHLGFRFPRQGMSQTLISLHSDRLEEGQQLWASPITGAGTTKPVAHKAWFYTLTAQSARRHYAVSMQRSNLRGKVPGFGVL